MHRHRRSFLALAAFAITATTALSAFGLDHDSQALVEFLSGRAQQYCSDPHAFGMTVSASGGLDASLDLPKFAKALGSPRLTGAIKAGGSEYVGVLQSDLARAYAQSDNCKLIALPIFERIYERAAAKNQPPHRLKASPSKAATVKSAGVIPPAPDGLAAQASSPAEPDHGALFYSRGSADVEDSYFEQPGWKGPLAQTGGSLTWKRNEFHAEGGFPRPTDQFVKWSNEELRTEALALAVRISECYQKSPTDAAAQTECYRTNAGRKALELASEMLQRARLSTEIDLNGIGAAVVKSQIAAGNFGSLLEASKFLMALARALPA